MIAAQPPGYSQPASPVDALSRAAITASTAMLATPEVSDPRTRVCLANGHKGTKQRRSWLAVPAPLKYARPDNDAQFLAQVTNPQVFVNACGLEAQDL
jgi:hypothetical protein